MAVEEGKVVHTTFEVDWTGGAPGEGVGIITGKTEPGEGHGEGYAFVPIFRVAASDLNFTIALAIMCFIAVEIVGFQAWGAKYLTKFFHLDFSHGIGQGVLNLFVGLIELISELARISRGRFRLFGNIFAGSVLLIVFMFLVPFLLVVPDLRPGAVRGPDPGLRVRDPDSGVHDAGRRAATRRRALGRPSLSIPGRLAFATRGVTRKWILKLPSCWVPAWPWAWAPSAPASASASSPMARCNAMGRNPEVSGELRTNMILGIVFAESVAIYALVIALILIFAV